MFSFPPILDGNAGVKLSNNADSGFPKPGIREIFYSVRDGSWGDRGTWQTASGRVGLLPTANDDVYIRHTVTIGTDIALNTRSVSAYNLFISGTLIFNTGASGSRFFAIANNIQCAGTLDISLALSSTFSVGGNNNNISNFIAGTTATFEYNGVNQDVLNLSYWNLSITGNGLKKLTSNLTILNSLGISGVGLDLMFYTLLITGTTNISSGAGLYASSSASIIFGGAVTANAPIIQFNTGNPTIEFRNGITFTGNFSPNVNFGNGNIVFSTNNQTFNIVSGGGNSITFDNQITISGSIQLTFAAASNSIGFNNTINGTVAGSTLINTTTLNFATAASVPSMTTGTWDFTTNANTIQYNGNYSATIPSYFTTFSSLTIGGTGTKTLGVNTTVNGNLNVVGTGSGSGTNAFFDNSIYTLFIGGTLSVSTATLINTGGGAITCVGQFTIGTAITSAAHIDYSVGNPNVELRGGLRCGTGYSEIYKFGTGTWTFTTNNQSLNIDGNAAVTSSLISIVISGAITVTNVGQVQVNSLNGNNAASTFLQGTNSVLYVYTSSNIMTTGVFNKSTNVNTVAYTANVSHTLQYTTYSNLQIYTTTAGVIKSLSGNTILTGNLTIGRSNISSSSSNLDCGIYTLTVNGTTLVTAQGTLSNTGGGAITFVGNVNFSSYNSGTDTSYINFSGNPNVEVRNGISFSRGYGATYNCGNGTWTFSTNNQNIFVTALYGGATVILNNIIISGAITVTNTSGATTGVFQINGSLNGNNAASTFVMGASTLLSYRAATQPMATGILDTSTNLNTWIYGLNNQNIKGGPSLVAKQVYRNLTLNGTGVKTLQGYVSVLNTYTLTAPATLALNGFTLTNP